MILTNNERRLIMSVRNGTAILNVWTIEDVKSQAQDENKNLSDKDCKEILGLIEKKHDAAIGINWDVISIWINFYIDEKEKT